MTKNVAVVQSVLPRCRGLTLSYLCRYATSASGSPQNCPLGDFSRVYLDRARLISSSCPGYTELLLPLRSVLWLNNIIACDSEKQINVSDSNSENL